MSYMLSAVISITILLLGSRHTSAASNAADDKPPAAAGSADSEPDFSKFPVLKGKVENVLGQVGSFIPPKEGEPFSLDLKDIQKVNKLSFDPTRKSYIPLLGKVAAKIHYATNDGFASMSLTWKEGRNQVRVDLSPIPGSGNPKRVRVWVVVEAGVIRGVTLIDTEYEGTFPPRRK